MTFATHSAGVDLQALVREMSGLLERAIASLATNSLADFEQCLWAQEMCAARLQQTLRSLKRQGASGLWAAHGTPLRSELERLARLNRCYEGIVRQGSQVNNALRGMCSFYQDTAAPCGAEASGSRLRKVAL